MNDNSTRRHGTMRRIGATFVVAGAVGVGAVSLGAPASADVPTAGPITVDGTNYTPTQVSGPVWHYETPTPNPSSASVAARQQVWTGHGSDHLPCPGGIHWVSNANLLTVSHCLGVTSTSEATTSTSTSETTSTSEATTSTSEVTTTSTSEVTTTSASEVTTTSASEVTTTSEVQQQLPPSQPERPLPSAPPLVEAAGPASGDPSSQSLPSTGSENWMLFFVALIMSGAGAILVEVARRDPAN